MVKLGISFVVTMAPLFVAMDGILDSLTVDVGSEIGTLALGLTIGTELACVVLSVTKVFVTEAEGVESCSDCTESVDERRLLPGRTSVRSTLDERPLVRSFCERKSLTD